MTIDIIEYTEAQYAALSAEKLEKIRAAQMKKNRLLRDLEEKLQKLKAKLVDGGVYAAYYYEKRSLALTAICQAEIDNVREGLLFYLHYATNEGTSGSSTPSTNVPYTVDYSMTVEERLGVVRAYYETTYTNGTQRFEAFAKDEFAKSYLGELYAPLYYRFQDDA